jgi:acid phosphatase (class A)
MSRHWLLALALLLSSGVAGPGCAQVFLDESAVQRVADIPPPPADDSPAGCADLETVLQVQADRTPQQEARARRVAPHTPFLMGSAVMGSWFTAENLPRTAAIMKAVWKQTNQATKALKKRWDRPRPSARDPRVHPCVTVPADASYPSGHSANATVWAAVFGAAFPEHAAEFDAQARETRWARVLGGAHFPSDTLAGRMLGENIAREMLGSAAMPGALGEIRAEVAAWRTQQPAPVRN